ncbi:unnamed protein product [Rhizophagus irregularis]|uniref:Uncharacterized protein n=1 Tax=Rhizophagus irregularis TaxID=588596 RepID=A0A2I1HDY1_9GLOM|nr:hypothetical protein RhiirA4_477916 [Rhizophagus irregularis]CAB4428352.1 unnamed protein product [Rhizophagus irregularis]CAB4446570.1 unnamed protein product [Rhizophagus irregularis]
MYEQAEQKRSKKQKKERKRLEEAQQEYDVYMGPKIQRHEEVFQEWEDYWMNKSYDTYQRIVCEICGTTMKEEKLELFKLPNWEGWHQQIFGSYKKCKL